MTNPYETSPNTLADAIRLAVLYQLKNIHTALPAKIVSYDYETKKANVQPMVDKRYTDGENQPLPILNNVPVIFPYAGGASITFPVKEGDFCLVIFCERSIDNFLSNGQQGVPTDPRIFDLSDGVAFMGLSPFNQTSPATNNEDLLITYADSSIRIKADGSVVIETTNTIAIGNQTTELLDVLSQTLDLLATSVTTNPGSPFGFATQWGALKAQIDAIKGSI